MHRLRLLVAVLTVASTFLCVAKPSAANPQQQAEVKVAGTPVPASLAKSLDMKKLKVGSAVTAKTSVALNVHGVFVPSGSTIHGQVISVQIGSGGEALSSLGIEFQKIEVTAGKEIPIHGVLQAVAPNLRNEPDTGAAGSGTLAKDTGHDSGATVPGPAGVSSVTDVAAMNARQSGPVLDRNSVGVVGIRNLELNKDAILVTTAKDLKLDSGTQLVIRVELLKQLK